MADTIQTTIQSLEPGAIVELFVLDMRSIGGGMQYFHAGTNQLSQDVVWRGIAYAHLPMEAEGFAVGSSGAMPRPKVRLANIDGAFSSTVAQYNDLIGCKITRKRTFVKYLDAVNFVGGVNPTANSAQQYPDEIWFIDQKVMETRYVIEWELASAFDVSGVMLPSRQVNQNSCPWTYRGPECGYTGRIYYNSLDVAVALVAGDACGKRVESCELRFGVTNPLPFGGFPGSTQYG